MGAQLSGLPANVALMLSQVTGAAVEAYAGDLVSVVLYGSAAEGRLSPTSDVNLLLVLRSFDGGKTAAFRKTLLAAEAAVRLRAMFLLEKEVSSAVECFAQKFADIVRRHRVLHGRDPFSGLTVPRTEEIFRLRQVLLNLTLRLRESYAFRGERTEQVVRTLADAVGPLRSAAATLAELEGVSAPDATAALRSLAASINSRGEGIVDQLFTVRQGGNPELEASEVMLGLTDLVMHMSEGAGRLR